MLVSQLMWQQAKEACALAIKMAPHYPDAYNLMALIHEDQNDPREALKYYLLAVHARSNV